MSFIQRTLDCVLPTLQGLRSPDPRFMAYATPCTAQRYLPTETGDFETLGRPGRVAVILDAENLAYSTRDHDLHLDFIRLAQILRQRLRRVEMHAVVSVRPDQVDATSLDAARAGWIGHARPIITTPRKRCANGDVTCAFVAATLLSRLKADTLVIGTGDGPLALDIARAARSSFPRCRQIATLSFKATTSHLLNRENAPEIDANLHLGRDVLA